MKKIGVFTPHFEGFWQHIYNLFTEIDLVSRKRTMLAIAKATSNRSCPHFEGMKLSPEITFVSRPQNEALLFALKIIPHLIGQKMGKMHPSLRIVYFLFTKNDSANKKCAFWRIAKVTYDLK